MRRRRCVLGRLGVVSLVAIAGACGSPTSSTTGAPEPGPAGAGGLRLTGTVEAVRSRTVPAPRLAGTSTPMIITTLAKPGTRVKTGELLVDFDRQEQQRIASDKRAELVDLDGQIEKKRAEQAAAEAKEKTGLVAAENDVARAKLEAGTNELIARVAAEKNTLTLEQNLAKLEQLRTTFGLKREAAAADLQILSIRRERAERALRYAEDNSKLMEIRASFPGLVVVRQMRRPGASGQVEIIEGDEVRPGQPVLDIVDTSSMQVRARLNQADAELVRTGDAGYGPPRWIPRAELQRSRRSGHASRRVQRHVPGRPFVRCARVDRRHARASAAGSHRVRRDRSPAGPACGLGAERRQVTARVWRSGLALVAIGGLGTFGWLRYGVQAAPNLPTADVTRGNYADVVEIRGEVRPVRTTLVMAPANAGELTILKIAKNGTAVKAGDVVAEFDAVMMRRTIQEKQSELRSAMAEVEQARAQTKITLEERSSGVRRAQFEVEKARLGLGDATIVGAIATERSKLALNDAEQRLREAQASEVSAKTTVQSDFTSRDRRIEKIKADLARAQQAVTALQATAPREGTVNVLPNYRSATPMGGPAEYRPGDKTYAGAPILELPDLSSVFLVARLDEADRGQLRVGQTAVIRADAIADRDYQATVSDISLLARADFSGGWPPAKQFDLRITFTNPDERLRPGMSAVARIGVGQIPNVLLVPAKAVFTEGGRTVVYRFGRRAFEAVPVEIIRRGREQAAIKGALSPGDRVALTSPVAEGKGKS